MNTTSIVLAGLRVLTAFRSFFSSTTYSQCMGGDVSSRIPGASSSGA